MPKKTDSKHYFSLAVRRNYEEVWRIIDRFDTQEQAQAALDEKRSYVGVFNYDNAEFRVVSGAEGESESGNRWQVRPDEKKPAPQKSRRKVKES